MEYRENSLTYQELLYISPYHIPTLEEIFKSVDNKVSIIIEVNEDNKVFRSILVNILKKYNGNFVIQSFDYDAIKYYKKCGFLVGLLVSDKKNRSLLNKYPDVDFINIKYDSIDRVEANKLKEKYFLIGYTLNNRDDVETYIKTFNNLVIDNIEEVFK